MNIKINKNKCNFKIKSEFLFIQNLLFPACKRKRERKRVREREREREKEREREREKEREE